MVKIPINPNTTKSKLEKLHTVRMAGPSIGMAKLGEDCHRKVWYGFHWVKPQTVLPARVNRIFKLGTICEKLMIDDLQAIGIEVYDQQLELWGFNRYIHGFIDGKCMKVPEAPKTEHLLEMKTMKDSLFKKLVKHGVKESNPGHYKQCQRYMGALSLTRTLYVCMNKDTCEIYTERLYFDAAVYSGLISLERDLVMSETPPMRISEDPSWYQCKFCDFHDICHYDDSIDENCRTCYHVDMYDDNVWKCGKNDDKVLPRKSQRLGCKEWVRGI